MHIFNITLQSVAALLAIGLLGFWIIKRNIIPENILRFLAVLAIEIALPCIVFVNIVTQFSPSSFLTWWHYPLCWFAFSLVALVLTLVASTASAKGTRREFAFTLFFQNGLFFPFIIITGIFGASNPYIPVLFIFIALHPSLFFGTNHLFFLRGKNGGGKDLTADRPESGFRWDRILNPVLISTLVAAAIKFSGVDKNLPTFLFTVFHMLGNMSLPLLMLILGGSLYVDFQRKGPIYIKEVMKFALIKNLLFPLVYIGLLVLIRPAYPIALMIFLQSAVPPITGIPIYTQRLGGNSSITNQFILVSFIVSALSIPVMFNLFTRYFPMP
jgi:malate permease and related proteins